LAGAEDGARYWWQYAAGAGDRGAGYCLSLHHRARGDGHAADFWLGQADDGTAAEDGRTTATVLRIVAQMTADSERDFSDTTRPVMTYASAAVNAGYRLYPDVEIPAPRTPLRPDTPGDPRCRHRPARRTIQPSTGPSARPVDDEEEHARYPAMPEPDHVLVQLAAPDAECASAFHKAVASAWRQITAEWPQKPGQREVFMRFLLDRRRLDLVPAAPGETGPPSP
jgi:hypothetical protein